MPAGGLPRGSEPMAGPPALADAGRQDSAAEFIGMLNHIDDSLSVGAYQLRVVGPYVEGSRLRTNSVRGHDGFARPRPATTSLPPARADRPSCQGAK